jgi:glyoxylase I family protein
MTINHVLAVIPVSDLEASSVWYQKLFDRAPDNNPMPSLVEWHVTENGWLQVFVDPEQAGNTSANLAVDDLAAELAAVAVRGLRPAEMLQANKGVQTCSLTARTVTPSP